MPVTKKFLIIPDTLNVGTVPEVAIEDKLLKAVEVPNKKYWGASTPLLAII